ncbi:MAG TPA: TetR/AcrR family transcriptional regulator [Acidimicrobiales bacterium]|nr:TetR/AcrR family transcriptional regulator [Acidimicrobiales bacterium]
MLLPGSQAPVDLDNRALGTRPGRSNEVARRTQRSRIIDAFAREIGLSGFEGTHVGTVCAAACVSTKDFYKHFESKKLCFCAAFDEGATIVVDRAIAAFRTTSGPWADRLGAALRTVLEILAENPSFARLSVVESYHVVPLGREHVDALVHRCRQAFGDHRFAAPTGVEDSDYERFLVASVIGPMSDYIVGGRTDRLPELEPLLTYALTLTDHPA